MTKTESDRVRDNLRRAKAYAEQAEEMLLTKQPKMFRGCLKTAKESLDDALAAFTTAEDREQSS